MEAATISLEQDRTQRSMEFVYKLGLRVMEMRQKNAKTPRYWLCEPSRCGGYGGRVFVLVAVRMPGDSEYPLSWLRYLYAEEDWQLAAAAQACINLCCWGGNDKVEETGDARWHGYEFSASLFDDETVSRWEQIKAMMVALLGEPGKWPGT